MKHQLQRLKPILTVTAITFAVFFFIIAFQVTAKAAQPMVATGCYHTVGVTLYSTVVAVGRNTEGQCNVGSWTDIEQVAAGDYHTVGMKSDGTVVAVGYNTYSQCNVFNWNLKRYNDELAADFGANGLWHYNGATWKKLTSWDPDDDMAGWLGWSDSLAADFGANGLWNYDGLVWRKKTSWDAGSGGMSGWSVGLAVDFDGNGLWNYNGSTWSKKTSWNAENLTDIDLYGNIL